MGELADPGLVAILTPALALALAGIHLFASGLRFLDTLPRSRWLSLSSGTAVAYVFVHLLPEVDRAAGTVARAENLVTRFVEHHVYFVALGGFVCFYGLEQFARQRSRRPESAGDGRPARDGIPEDEEGSADAVFWVHVGSFVVYNVLIGYLLLHREERGATDLLLFAVAIGLHFLVNDYGLHDHHGRAYRRIGRWVLAAAVLLGTAVGYVVELDEGHVAVLLAFVGGSVVLNVIKEELPAHRESRFWAFAAGVVAYSVLLLLV